MSMGRELRKLKSKLLTSKKGQEMAKKDNGIASEGSEIITGTNGAVVDGERVELTEEVAQLWRAIFAQRQQLQEAAVELDGRIQSLLIAAGWSGKDIIEGDLGEESPYFVLKSAGTIITE